MSIFRSSTLQCPACGTDVVFEAVHSVNADRRPDLRVAILERSFQRRECPGCGHAFRMAPQFTYLDTGRRQFIAVYPAEKVEQWPEHEQHTQDAFAKAFGPGSGVESLGASLQARCVFGWGALNEKLIVAEAGIDDRLLELLKIAVMRNMDNVKLGTSKALRCVGIDGDELIIGWLSHATEELQDELAVPRSVLADIEAKPEAWAELRAQVVGPMFVDYQRALVEPVQA